MKTKGKLNKGVALVLSAALLMGLTPAIPDMSLKSYAVTTIDTEAPSIQAYITKETLVSNDRTINKFIPDDDGKNDIVGLLYFGKNSKGASQKWYILGKDGGVSGDNIAIFAASNITTNCFYNDTSSHSYVGDDDEAYVTESEKPSSVYANHYGESDIREALRKMAGDEGTDTYKYFTDTEKKMMQKTKVLTHEYSNNHLYTTNDKLYLASGSTGTKNIINVGSVSKSEGSIANNEYTSIKLSWENYWNVGSWFWLRSPFDSHSLDALNANPHDGFIYYINVSVNVDYSGVRPASNLNLSSVLFASAADATSDNENGGTITTSGTNQAAMILRLDGKDQNIGKFTYNKDGITVTKGTTESTTEGTAKDIFLVVQGKTAKVDDTEGVDWYYSKKITADETVTLATIAAGAEIDETKIDLTSPNCKIWLETPVSDADKLCYAVDNGIQHTHEWSDKLTPYDSKQHGYECTDPDCPYKGKAEGFKELEAHTSGADGVCTKCGYTKGDHIVTYFPEKAATSTTVGYKEHYECSHCDKWFKYPAKLGILESESKSYFEIPATGNKSSGNKNSDRYKRDSGSSSGSSSGASSTIAIINNGSTTGWSKDESGRWWYYDGNTKIIGWTYDKQAGKWYYVDESKGMLYGWIQDTVDGYWYYLDNNTGEMLTGWQLIDGKQYYFAPASQTATYIFDESSYKWVYSNAANNRPYGAMYAGTITPDNQRVDADGARIQ